MAVKRVAIGIAVGLCAALVLLGLAAVAQANAVGVYFLFDRSGSMSRAGVDAELRHGSETTALLAPTDRAGGGFFSNVFQELAPLGDPIAASLAFTAAVGTSPGSSSNLLAGLTEAQAQLDAWSGQRAIVIYGDGCTDNSDAARVRIQELQDAGYLLAYVKVESGCDHVADDVDLYYTPAALPTPEELVQAIRRVPTSVEGVAYGAYRGDLINIKWNLPITATWSYQDPTPLTTLQKEYEVEWGPIQPDPGDGSTLLAFASPNDTGAPLTYTVPFTWNGLVGQHTIVVAAAGMYDHLEVGFPPLIEVEEVFTFTVSAVDRWGGVPALPLPAEWDDLYLLGGSRTLVQPSAWTWQAGLGTTQAFTASARLGGSESLQFLLGGALEGWSNTFQVTIPDPGPFRTYLPVMVRNHSP